MNLLYKLLRQDPECRDGVVLTTSVLGIAVNLLLAAVKVAVGSMVASIAIVSEGINNATDSVTSLLTLVGTKLSRKKPTAKHPFGFGRIEYLTSLIISVLILITGFEFLKSSVELIFAPVEMSISVSTLVVVALSAAVKLLLGGYTIKMGKKACCGSLVAVGTDCRNDSVISAVTLLSAGIFLVFHVSVDAYAGIVTSLFILKAGIGVLLDTLGDLLGKPASKELADKLYKEIRSCDLVLNAADMMLHNYGPDAYSGSVNIEIDHEKTIGEIYEVIHALQIRLAREYGVTMVFGMYAVDRDHPASSALRQVVAQFVREQPHVTSYHAIYLPDDEKKIFCDLVVDYELKDWTPLEAEFRALMKKNYPDYEVELTVETEYV